MPKYGRADQAAPVPTGFPSYEAWLKDVLVHQDLYVAASTPGGREAILYALKRERARTQLVAALETPRLVPGTFHDGRTDRANLAQRTLPPPNPKGFQG